MSTPLPPGTIVAGKYRVERLIGKGGMGFVLAATDLALARQVAIKCLRPMTGDDETILGRFTREARAAASLQSDHVARVFDAGTLPSGIPYIVLELLDGVSLADIVKRREKQPVSAVIDYALQACDGLIEAHARGIVHRDLKPANLFLARSPTGPSRIKVLDFGISKLLDGGSQAPDDFTPTGMIFGSPRYMSPEQLRSAKHVDQATDIWSLGTIVYELLAGAPAFPGPSLEQTVSQIRGARATPLNELRADVSPALAAVVQRCLEKDPARRYRSMRALAEALAPLAPPASPIAARFRRTSAAATPSQADETVDALMAPPEGAAPAHRASRRGALVALSFFASVAVGGAGVHLLFGPQLMNAPAAAPPAAIASVTPASATSVVAAASAGAQSAAPLRDALRLVGAVSAGDRFAHEWVKSFESSHPGVNVRLEPAASGLAIDAVLRGAADVAIVSRAATSDERARAQSLGHPFDQRGAESLVAVDAIAVVVNPENPVRELTLEQVRAVFSGDVVDWSPFGGKRRPITVLRRPDDLGIEEAFRATVLGSGVRYPSGAIVIRATKDVIDRVRREPDAIAIVGLDAASGTKALRVAAAAGDEAVAPSARTVRSRTYPLARPIFLYSRGAPENAAKAFVSYVVGEGQNDLRRTETVPATLELLADREGSDRVSQACSLPIEPRRKFSSDYRFRHGALIFDDLAVRDLDRMAEHLCESAGRRVDLLGVLEDGPHGGRDEEGARARAMTVRTELVARCRTLQVRCVAVASEPGGPATTGRAENVGRVEVWVSGGS